MPGQDLDVMVGQCQCFFKSRFAGNISNLRVGKNRNVSMTGVADGTNKVGVGIPKYSVSFERPALKDDSRQIDSETFFANPQDIDYVKGKHVFRLFNFFVSGEDLANNPDAGSTTDSFNGSCTDRRRIK
mgnify:CR=1 FL=1